MNFTPTELGASIIFAIAVLHTFCTGYFETIAKKSPRHAGLWHLLGEVEIVFGFWAAVLVIFISLYDDLGTAKHFLNKRNFTEPLFVFAIMIVAAKLHFLESYRDRLIANDEAFTKMIEQYPDMDIQNMRTIIRNARREKEQNKPPKAWLRPPMG